MKKILFLLIFIIFSPRLCAQAEEKHDNKRGELNFETNTGKFFQGAIISSFTYFTLQQFTKDSKEEWIKIPLSILTAYFYEAAFNKGTNDQKQLFVLSGAVTVTVSFEIFKGKRRR